MDKAVYTVSTAVLYEHPSLKLATADYDVAQECFEALVRDGGGWVTVILEEWYNGTTTTIDMVREK